MAKVLSDFEITDLECWANEGFSRNGDSTEEHIEGLQADYLDLIATIRALQKQLELVSEIGFGRGEFIEKIDNAARDFLQAFRAHWVFDRTEEFNVTANRLREAEARLASLLGEGEGE